jgi:hypothetical protein
MRVNGVPPVSSDGFQPLPEQRLIQTGHPDDDEHGGTDVEWPRDNFHKLTLMQIEVNKSKIIAVQKVV